METTVLPRERESVVRDIHTYLLAGGELPSPKGVAQRLMSLAQDPDAGVADAARLVKSDPALTGVILRAANSARYGGGPKLVDVTRAINRLGMNMVRIYAISVSMMNEYRKGGCKDFDYARYWGQCLYAGITMDSLSRRCDGFPREEAFVLGLLGKIGQLAFATAAAEEYSSVLRKAAESGIELAELERRTFGFDTNEISAVMLVEWGIPTGLADVVYWQRDPEGGGYTPDSVQYQLAAALQLAAQLAATILSSAGGFEHVSSLYLRAATLDIEPEELRTVSERALLEFRDWAKLVGLPQLASQMLPQYCPA